MQPTSASVRFYFEVWDRMCSFSILCGASRSHRQASHISSRRVTSVPYNALLCLCLLASGCRTLAPPPGVPPERSPIKERHGPCGGWRDAGDGRRRRSDAEPAEEQSQAEKAKGVVRLPDVLCGGTSGGCRGAEDGGTESRWGAVLFPSWMRVSEERQRLCGVFHRQQQQAVRGKRNIQTEQILLLFSEAQHHLRTVMGTF